MFKYIITLAFLLIGCGSPLPPYGASSGSGGSGGLDAVSSSSASSSSSSSSSGLPVFECNGQIDLLAPFNGDFGYPYFEDGVHVCRRFGPGTYSTARISWSTGGPCATAPRWTYAVAPWDSLTGFSFAEPATVPEDGIVALSADVAQGDSLFVCAVLSTTPRSCISSCRDVGDPDSFWGDTGADGQTLVPPVLESLSASPSIQEAMSFGNDKQRLMIDAWYRPAEHALRGVMRSSVASPSDAKECHD